MDFFKTLASSARRPAYRTGRRGAVNSNILVVGGLITFIVIVMIFFSWVGSYLTARVTGVTSGDSYQPLIRYFNGTTWCYDNDTGYCARTRAAQPFVQQAVVGDLIAGGPGQGVALLYGCFDRARTTYTVAVNSRSECYRRFAAPFLLGRISTQNLPATSPLFVCANGTQSGTYVTTTESECNTEGRLVAQQMGYIRTNTTTGAVKTAAPAVPEPGAPAVTAAAVPPEQAPLAAIPQAASTDPLDVDQNGCVGAADAQFVMDVLQGKREHNGRADTNGDGQILPQDALLIINYLIKNPDAAARCGAEAPVLPSSRLPSPKPSTVPTTAPRVSPSPAANPLSGSFVVPLPGATITKPAPITVLFRLLSSPGNPPVCHEWYLDGQRITLGTPGERTCN